MNLESIYLNSRGLLHCPYVNSAVRTINDYALRYQEVITGDQYPVIRLLDIRSKHSFFEARWANDSPIQNLVWYDVYEQDSKTFEWNVFKLCLGYADKLIDQEGREVNKYGKWVRFAANRAEDWVTEAAINAYELAISNSHQLTVLEEPA